MSENQNAAINAFMEKIIDYAGLFPPAKLPLGSAFGNYSEYKKSKHSNFLSRFICPAGQLPELAKLISADKDKHKEISVSVLASNSENTEKFYSNFNEDLANWSEFIKSFDNSVLTETLEMKIPDDLILGGDSEKISEFITNVSEKIGIATGRNIFIFFECITGADWKNNIGHLIKGISIHNASGQNNGGFKLRTGGVTVDSFPGSETIVYSIKECLDNSVSMKCTAGLHHPVRHFDKEIGTMMHGFLNVFGAGIISMRHNISDSDMLKILNDEDPGNFKFSDSVFEWNGYSVSIEDIRSARNNLMISFGSCSFDDPVNDLQKINLI